MGKVAIPIPLPLPLPLPLGADLPDPTPRDATSVGDFLLIPHRSFRYYYGTLLNVVMYLLMAAGVAVDGVGPRSGNGSSGASSMPKLANASP